MGDDQFGVATVLTGITIEHDFPNSVPELIAINRRLQQRAIPALLCRGFDHPLEMKRRLRLPMLFPIHAFVSREQSERQHCFWA